MPTCVVIGTMEIPRPDRWHLKMEHQCRLSCYGSYLRGNTATCYSGPTLALAGVGCGNGTLDYEYYGVYQTIDNLPPYLVRGIISVLGKCLPWSAILPL
jgi:hypothetical protein